MNRKSFIGGLLALVAAPKSIAIKMAEPAKAVAGVKTIGAYSALSKQALRNIKFLQSWLPSEMLKDYEKEEPLNFRDLVSSGHSSKTDFVTYRDT